MSEHLEHVAPPAPTAPPAPSDLSHSPALAQPQARPRSAWCCAPAWAALLGITILAITLDLASKWLAFRSIAGTPVTLDPDAVRRVVAEDARFVGQFIPRHEPITLIPHGLDLTLVLNPGAVFGVAPGGRWFFVLFTAAALAFGLWIFGTWTRARDRWAHVALGLVIGGGLGNVYDRLVYGCVRDFIHPLPGVKFPFGLKLLDRDGFIWPYVSNVADLLLLIGIGMLLLFLWKREPPRPPAPRQSSAATPPAPAQG